MNHVSSFATLFTFHTVNPDCWKPEEADWIDQILSILKAVSKGQCLSLIKCYKNGKLHKYYFDVLQQGNKT